MSKRPSTQPSKRSNQHTSTELDPKMLNIAAGGHFYERAKSRRQRHREIFASGAGRAVTDEALPLGVKRKNKGSVKAALARLNAGTGKSDGGCANGASSAFAGESASEKVHAETNEKIKSGNSVITKDSSGMKRKQSTLSEKPRDKKKDKSNRDNDRFDWRVETRINKA